MEQRHSKLGIASFTLSIVSGLVLCLIIVIAGFMNAPTPGGIDEESPEILITGLCVLAVLALAVVAFGLGIGGLFQSDRKRTLAVLGSVFSAAPILGTISLILIGMAKG